MKNNKHFLYKQIVDDIVHDIKTNKLKAGDRIPTDLELSQKYNVSRITITRAAQELEKQNLIYRIKGSGSYVKDIETSGSKATNSYIPLVIPFSEKFSYDLLSGVEASLKNKNLYVSIHNSNYDIHREREIIEELIGENVPGFIIYPCSSQQNLDIYSTLILKKTPLVTVDRTLDGLSPCSVMADNYDGFYKITKYLISMGHKNILFVSNHMKHSTGELERYKGYCQALLDSNIRIRQELIYDTFLSSDELRYSDSSKYADIHMESALKVIDYTKSLTNKPTAIAAVNDITAIYIIKAAISQNIIVPDDLSVTGFDNLSLSEHIDVPLTTIEQSFYEMGQKAGDLLAMQIQKDEIIKREYTITTKLVTRRSVVQIN